MERAEPAINCHPLALVLLLVLDVPQGLPCLNWVEKRERKRVKGGAADDDILHTGQFLSLVQRAQDWAPVRVFHLRASAPFVQEPLRFPERMPRRAHSVLARQLYGINYLFLEGK